MKNYKYKAVTQDGSLREGEKFAENEREVVEFLYSENLIPLSVKEKKKKLILPLLKKVKSRRKIKKQEAIGFFQSMAVLIEAGIPVDKALIICRDITESEQFKMVISDILNDVRSGTSLSEALYKYPKIFPKLYINMIKTGEAAGILDKVMERIYYHFKKTEEFKEKIISSLIYPTFLIATGLISIVVMIIFVVPRFKSIFESMGVNPPFPIPLLSSIGNLFHQHWPMVIGLILFFIATISLWRKKPENRKKLYEISLKIPFLGEIFRKTENVKFANNLGVLLINGVPILKAIAIVKEMFSNPLFFSEMEKLYVKLREGNRVSQILEENKNLWHPVIIGMCNVGEESGRLGEMLIKASEALEREVEQKLTKLISLIEPITILTMGLIVGSIVVSMISAIFSVNEIVR